jgi:hypothetical protein
VNASDLARLSNTDLMEVLLGGHAIDADALAGKDYGGTSLGIPRFVERLTWKRFMKSFRRDDAGRLGGFNVRIDNARPGWTPLLRGGAPVTFGPFAVVSPGGHRMPRPAKRGLLLDYSEGGSRSGMLARVRDPLVAVTPGDVSLLLGWTYLDLGLTQVATPSFFTLELA